jgi:nitroreductase
MNQSELMELIKERRSVRKFQDKEVPIKIIKNSLEAARWAPSGLNNQPWNFMILEKTEKDSLAKYTKFSQVIKQANKLIIVLLNKEKMYSHKKDLMAIGAAIQNILIYLQSQNIGSCWLGEIINQAEQVQDKLQLPTKLELAAVIGVGFAQKKVEPTPRNSLEELIL